MAGQWEPAEQLLGAAGIIWVQMMALEDFVLDETAAREGLASRGPQLQDTCRARPPCTLDITRGCPLFCSWKDWLRTNHKTSDIWKPNGQPSEKLLTGFSCWPLRSGLGRRSRRSPSHYDRGLCLSLGRRYLKQQFEMAAKPSQRNIKYAGGILLTW